MFIDVYFDFGVYLTSLRRCGTATMMNGEDSDDVMDGSDDMMDGSDDMVDDSADDEVVVVGSKSEDDDAADDAADDDADEAKIRCAVCHQWVAASRFGNTALNMHSCSRTQSVHTDYWAMYRCARHGCGQVFNGLSNMGNHQCFMHPGTYDEETGYSCCGMKRMGVVNKYTFNMVWSRRGKHEPFPIEPRGCTPCDHLNPDMPACTNLLNRPVRLRNPKDLPLSVQGSMDPHPVNRKGYTVGADGEPMLRGVS